MNNKNFKKPFSKELYGKEFDGYYPYPAEELAKHSVFPYLILDGGSFNLMNDRFGTANGDDILKLTLNGKLFDIFRTKGEFNWEASFAYVEGTCFTKKYEWQIWPQRLYFTIPLAHKFLQTGERKYSDAWLTIIKEWDRAHPYQEFDPEVNYLDTDMVWRDMQVAWRTMSLLHGIFMLQNAPFTIEGWKYLYDFVNLHMKHLYIEAIDRLSRNYAQNHVLQIGVVLLFTVSMFPEAENVSEMTKIALDTVEMNLKNAVFDDGGSDEDSPSYSHFIARLYLESLRIIENNNFPEIKGLRESVKKQYEWLYQCMTPSGKTLSLSDSYSFDVLQDLDYVSKLIDLDFERIQKNIFYPDSNIAVFRKGEMTVFVDAVPWPGHHHHAGTPQIVSYYGEYPVLTDTGVCNYDRWEMYDYLHSFKAHNVVYNADFDYHECTVVPEIESVDIKSGTMRIKTAVVNKNGMSYIWIREILVSDNKIIISDKAESKIEMPFVSRLFFKKNDVYFPKDDKQNMQLLTDSYLMTLSSKKNLSMELAPVMNEDNKVDYAVVCESKEKTKIFENKIILKFKKR